jgi:hypothetical protein
MSVCAGHSSADIATNRGTNVARVWGFAVSGIGIVLIGWGFLSAANDDVAKPNENSDQAALTIFAGLVCCLIGLIVLLIDMARRSRHVDASAKPTGLSTTPNDLIRSFHAGRNSYAPLIFFFFAILGSCWGFIYDDWANFGLSELAALLAFHLPFGLLLAIGVWHCYRHGKFLGLTLQWFLTFSALGFIAPFLLFVLTD